VFERRFVVGCNISVGFDLVRLRCTFGFLAMQGSCAAQGSLLRSWLCGQRAGHATVAVKHVLSSTQGMCVFDSMLPEMENLTLNNVLGTYKFMTILKNFY
jgi:hypothetical protein